MSARRILILTASYGEGHNSAARALRAAFAEHPGTEPVVADLFAALAPRLDPLLRRAYLGLINRAPGLWRRAYGWLDRSPRAPLLFRALAPHRAALARLIAEQRPHAICSTYPVYPWLLQALRSRGVAVPPAYTVVTDALSINSLWHRATADGWFVTDPDSAAQLRAAGLPPARVAVSGFPVALAFADRDPALRPPDPAAGGRRRVLFMINSGRTGALATARALLARPDLALTLTAGRDEGLRRELESLARSAPAEARVLGWTDRVPELLMTHHVVVGKAGGATTQEGIAALCPMVVNQVVPGQEEGNWELLRRHRAGVLATSPAAVVAALDDAFADRAARWHAWREGLRRLVRPGAARTIAAAVLRGRGAPLSAAP